MILKIISKNRWIIILSSILIQLCLGAIYAWGVFLNPIMAEFDWSKTEVSLAFTIFLVSYAAATIFGGKWQDIHGPQIVATAGGVLIGIGYYLAGLTHSLTWLYITYGLIGGAGVGIGYVCPIATCVKWFPDRKGLATGLSVAGFGAGALIFAPIASYLINTFHWRIAFNTLGVIFIVVITIAALFLRNPPDDWSANKFSALEKIRSIKEGLDTNWKGMIQTNQFWLLWIMFAFGATAGLMLIGHIASYGIQVGLTEGSAAILVGTLAFFNGAGRILWGIVSDKIGRSLTISSIMFLLGSSMLILLFINLLAPLLIIAALIGLAFGGILAIFPATTADYFGLKNMGENYGVMFSAYGLGGVLGPLIGAIVFDSTGTYLYAIVTAAIVCYIAGALALLLKMPEKIINTEKPELISLKFLKKKME